MLQGGQRGARLPMRPSAHASACLSSVCLMTESPACLMTESPACLVTESPRLSDDGVATTGRTTTHPPHQGALTRARARQAAASRVQTRRMRPGCGTRSTASPPRPPRKSRLGRPCPSSAASRIPQPAARARRRALLPFPSLPRSSSPAVSRLRVAALPPPPRPLSGARVRHGRRRGGRAAGGASWPLDGRGPALQPRRQRAKGAGGQQGPRAEGGEGGRLRRCSHHGTEDTNGPPLRRRLLRASPSPPRRRAGSGRAALKRDWLTWPPRPAPRPCTRPGAPAKGGGGEEDGERGERERGGEGGTRAAPRGTGPASPRARPILAAAAPPFCWAGGRGEATPRGGRVREARLRHAGLSTAPGPERQRARRKGGEGWTGKGGGGGGSGAPVPGQLAIGPCARPRRRSTRLSSPRPCSSPPRAPLPQARPPPHRRAAASPSAPSPRGGGGGAVLPLPEPVRQRPKPRGGAALEEGETRGEEGGAQSGGGGARDEAAREGGGREGERGQAAARVLVHATLRRRRRLCDRLMFCIYPCPPPKGPRSPSPLLPV